MRLIQMTPILVGNDVYPIFFVIERAEGRRQGRVRLSNYRMMRTAQQEGGRGGEYDTDTQHLNENHSIW
jgi:hypothetical protein